MPPEPRPSEPRPAEPQPSVLSRSPHPHPMSTLPRYDCLGLLLLPIGLYWLAKRGK